MIRDTSSLILVLASGLTLSACETSGSSGAYYYDPYPYRSGVYFYDDRYYRHHYNHDRPNHRPDRPIRPPSARPPVRPHPMTTRPGGGGGFRGGRR